MLLNHTSKYVAVGLLLLLLATPSLGQGPQGMQIFALDDESTYGGAQAPNQGYFFQFDGLWWSISPPRVHPIGYPNDTQQVSYGPNPIDVRTETNTLDTSQLSGQFSAGNRIEFGRIEDQDGWLVSIFQLRDQEQDYTLPAGSVVFNDPPDGPGGPLLNGNVYTNPNSTPPNSPAVFRNLPVLFSSVFIQEEVNTWGVEANYVHRFDTRHAGGTFEMFLGARYFEFNDTFNVYTGQDTGTLKVPSFLGGSYWDTEAQNHVVGGQIGLRWFKKQGRWTFSTEGRFMAGLNCQNISQTADFGPNLNPGINADGSYTPFMPTRLGHTTTTTVAYAREWSPAIELRLEFKYQLTRSISAHAGWSGFWMDGVARASSVIDYTTSNAKGQPMGVNLADNREDILLNGLTLGFDVNR